MDNSAKILTKLDYIERRLKERNEMQKDATTIQLLALVHGFALDGSTIDADINKGIGKALDKLLEKYLLSSRENSTP